MSKVEDKDLILMHLEGFEEFRDEKEVPYGLTPRGITYAVGISESEPYKTLEDMSEEGLIEEDTRIIMGEDQERNVYFLTEKGKKREEEFRDEVKGKEVTLKTDDGEKNLKLEYVENHVGGRNPMVKALRTMDENDVIDLTGHDKGSEVFVGRKEELKNLRENLRKVKKEGVKTLFVEGKAGIGKTSLVSKLKPFAQELGFKFLSGNCQSETSDPYLPFREAFSEYVESKQEQERTSMAFIGTGNEDTVKDKNLFDAKKEETFYETTNYIKEIAEDDPLVVFLDDLQWVDRATLDILAYMDDKLGGAPVFLIGAYRPEDLSENHHLLEMMHRLSRKNRIDKIELEPLTYKDTKETVKGVLGEEEVPEYFVDRLHRKTKGNPLFIKESLRQMVEEGTVDLEKNEYPKSEEDFSFSGLVHDVIERRINRLDAETIKIIELGSVIGKEVPFTLLSKTANIDEIDLLDHIDILIGNQLWNEDPNDELFYFSHDLIQETVYNSIKKLKRKLLHKRVAQNIEKIYQHELEDWYSDLAKHHQGAEKYSDALDYYLKAGERAEEVYAHEDAIEMYKKSSSLVDKVKDPKTTKIEIWEKLADACKILGRYEESREFLDKICEHDKSSVDTLRAYRKKSTTWLEQGRWDKASESIETALDIDGSGEGAKKEIFELKSNMGWVQMRLGEYDESKEIFLEVKKMSERLGEDRLIAKSYHNLGSLNYMMENIDEAISFFEEAIEILEELDDIQSLTSTLNNLGLVKMYRMRWDEARKDFKRGLKRCEEIGETKGVCIALNNLGDVYREKGNFEKALEHFNRGLKKAEKISDEHGIAGFLTNIGITYQKVGELDEAFTYYEKGLKKFKELKSKTRIAWVKQHMGDIYTARDEWDKAFEAYEISRDIYEEIGEEKEKRSVLADIAEAYVKSGQIEKAEKIARETLEEPENWDSIILEAACKRLLGILYREKDELEKAEEYLIGSKEILKDQSPTDYPQVLFELGVLYQKKEKNEKARQYLEKALGLFDEMGMKRWENKTQEQLEEA
ncbi:MAG: tetratricopeptide repeat protein [Candidatus Natronoplasma sp.]